MSEDELLDIYEAGSWEPKGNESRGKIRKYKCDCLDDIELGTTIGGWGFDELTEVTKENIEEVKARAKKECNDCEGTGVLKVKLELTVETNSGDFELPSNDSPIYGNVRFMAESFHLVETKLWWNYEEEEFEGFDVDYEQEKDDLYLTRLWGYPDNTYPTVDISGYTERFMFDVDDIIRLFELKDKTKKNLLEYRPVFSPGWDNGIFDNQYISTYNFNSSLLKFNFEEEDTYETCMKKWESFKGSLKRVSSVDHFHLFNRPPKS